MFWSLRLSRSIRLIRDGLQVTYVGLLFSYIFGEKEKRRRGNIAKTRSEGTEVTSSLWAWGWWRRQYELGLWAWANWSCIAEEADAAICQVLWPGHVPRHYINVPISQGLHQLLKNDFYIQSPLLVFKQISPPLFYLTERLTTYHWQIMGDKLLIIQANIRKACETIYGFFHNPDFERASPLLFTKPYATLNIKNKLSSVLYYYSQWQTYYPSSTSQLLLNRTTKAPFCAMICAAKSQHIQ